MKPAVLLLLFAFSPLTVQAQSTPQAPPAKAQSTPKAPAAKPPARAVAPATQDIPTERIGAPPVTPPPVTVQTATAVYFQPAQVKALLHKVYVAQFRINDLLTQVNPDKWKLPESARKSFAQTLESLHQALANQEDWRVQFDQRPDSLYLGFQTYVAINAVLPRLDGLAHSVAQYENPSFGAQYSQAGNQLFDLQQALQPYLALLMKNQDGVLLVAQNNLASCQNTLGFAMRPRQEKAVPMRNIAPDFKGRRVHHNAAPAASAKPEKGSEEKTTSTKAGSKKIATHSSPRTQPSK